MQLTLFLYDLYLLITIQLVKLLTCSNIPILEATNPLYMSREIRRLHRKQTQFTNFSSSQTTQLTNPNEPSELNTENNLNQPTRRRRQSNPSPNINDISALPNPTQSSEQSIKEDFKDTPLVNNSDSPLSFNNINTIRAEFQEDAYHRKLAQSNFSDDTHDWGGELHDLSDDYWHFVGSFE